MVKILEEIELNEVGTNGMLFDIYFDEHSNRFRAKDINGTLTLEYDLIGVAGQIAQEHREEILTYRLGRITEDDIVEIGDIFMYGKFNRLVEHKTWEVNKPATKDIKRMIIENFIDWHTTNEEEREQMKIDAMVYVEEDHVDEIAQAYNL